MTTIEKHETLVEALCAAALEMEYVGKGQQNKHEGYAFRGIDDVMFGVRNPLMRHGVFVHFTYGRATSVLPPEHPDHDPYFFRLPIKASIRHAHSDQTLEAVFEGLGRQAGKGNVTNPDPRALGQASSYGIKMWLLGEFMVAGGDDSADEAPKADGPAEPAKSRKKADKPEPAPADPELEEARTGVLADIASLAPEIQKDLAEVLKAEQLSVKKATSIAELERVAEIIAALTDTMDNEVDTAEEPEAEEAQVAPDNEVDTAPAMTMEEEAALLASARTKVTEERHLAAVPDETPEPPAEEPAKPAPKASRAPRTTKATITQPVADESGLNDMELAYVIASGGLGTSASKLGGNMKLVKVALDLIKDLKAGKIIREGLAFIDADTKEVVVDGTEAVEHYRAS